MTNCNTNCNTEPVTVKAAVVETPPVEDYEIQTENEPFTSIGFEVIPAEMKGKSPYAARFVIICGMPATDYEIDFGDDTAIESGKLVRSGEYKAVRIRHIYTYIQGDDKHTGHQYYPKITITGKDPDGNTITNVFNTAEKGRCLMIEVQSRPAED